MAGRPPLPTRLKVLRGTLNPSRVNQREPQLEPAMPRPPEYLSHVERAAWDKFAAILGPMRVVAMEDAVALEMLAVTYAQHQRLAQTLRESKNLVYLPPGGKPGSSQMLRARPEVALLADVDRRLLALLSRFGLTPADRAKVVQQDSPLSEQAEDEFA